MLCGYGEDALRLSLEGKEEAVAVKCTVDKFIADEAREHADHPVSACAGEADDAVERQGRLTAEHLDEVGFLVSIAHHALRLPFEWWMRSQGPRAVKAA